MTLVFIEAIHKPETVDWRRQGLCREHPEVDFFPVDGFGVSKAQRICADCPVREDCLEYALVHNESHGVWGGVSERERIKLRRRRRLEERG